MFAGTVRLSFGGLAYIAGLRDLSDKRGDWAFCVGILRGADQAICVAQLRREVMEHQRPAAETVSAHFKAGPVGREWVLAHWPVLLPGNELCNGELMRTWHGNASTCPSP